MITSSVLDATTNDLKIDEGRRDRPYRDTAGKLTIGYGHNLDADGLCEGALLAQLQHDLQGAKNALDARIEWWGTTPPAVQRVLLNLTFNLGISGLLTFGAFLALVQLGRYREAAEDLRGTLLARQAPNRVERLAKLLESVL